MPSLELDVVLTPDLLHSSDTLEQSIALVIDVFRATTTIAYALHHQAKEVFTLPSLSAAEAKARELRSHLGDSMVVLCGERDGLKPEHFDLGNSPREYTVEHVCGKTIVLATSNGTKAIERVSTAPLVLAAAFINLRSVANFIVRYIVLNEARYGDYHYTTTASIPTITTITCVCAGSNKNFSYEDTLCAGALVDTLQQELACNDYDITLSDAAVAAQHLYRAHRDNLSTVLHTTNHAQYLQRIGFGDDILAAIAFNTCSIIPLRRTDGAFVHWHNPLNL
ncbi:MAG: 2-phosphosulfolactate phosphatase [Bacteroidota bacterium]|nr:2-phosphosulfolactate phosphatase [Candidatus Kapabacteria bacterium]MDW8220764.1 2-phosphosulfolactate phosphatase [Bacteroidota bacterium]